MYAFQGWVSVPEGKACVKAQALKPETLDSLCTWATAWPVHRLPQACDALTWPWHLSWRVGHMGTAGHCLPWEHTQVSSHQACL